jgi:hypothetical protein
MTVRYVRVLRSPSDSERVLRQLTGAFADTGARLTRWLTNAEGGSPPRWVGVHFTAERLTTNDCEPRYWTGLPHRDWPTS